MKKRFQRLISFALTLVMLVTMIPAGMFTATAEVSAALSAALADLENATELVINNVDDWKAVANVEHSFEGKTIKLGADIDAGGEALPTLFGLTDFKGNFDGQGYTVKNATVTSTGDSALIATTMVGGKITNVKFDQITVEGAGIVGFLASKISSKASLEISKINATNISVTNSGTVTGGVVGQMINNGHAVVITKINVEGSVNHTGGTVIENFGTAGSAAGTGGNAGGFFGTGAFTAVGTTKISSIESKMAVTATTTTHVATFISHYTVVTGTKVEFENIYVGGSLVDNYANTAWTAGFVGKFSGVANEDVATIKNLVLNIDMSGATGNALTFAGVHNGNLSYSEVFSTTNSGGGAHSTKTTRWTGMSHNVTSFFNTVYAPWASADPIQSSITIVDEITADKMVFKDGDGYIFAVQHPEYADKSEEAEEFVISSLEDWNEIAAMNRTFYGSTFKLDADIDAEGETIQPLFGNKAFYGSFDGQGHTIKNAVVSGDSNIALIASVFCGGKITNVNFDNITVSTTAGSAGLVAGHNPAWENVEISKITATNITINNDGKGNTGGLVGNHVNHGVTEIVTKINFQGAVNHNNSIGSIGGLLGSAVVGGVTQFSYISVATDIFVAQAATPVNTVGGCFGYYMVEDGKIIEIDEIFCGGSIDGNGSSTPNNAGFAGMFTGTAGKNISDINNVIVATDMTKACGNSVTFAQVLNGNLVYQNVYSINSSNNGTWSGSTQRWTGMSHNANSLFNGVYNPWAAGDPIRNSVMVVPMTIAELLVKTDADGYLSAISSIAPNESVLPNYATTEEFIISSVEDWKLLASSYQSFVGKTIKLSADIDAKGEALPTLILNMTATNVIFDGQGHTIKNVGTVSAPAATPLIAYQLGAATVKNVNFENVHVSLNDEAGLIAFSIQNSGNALIQYIKVTNCTVTSMKNAAGALFGKVTDTVDSAVTTITSINVDENTKITGNSSTGGVIGSVRHLGTLNISNIMTSAAVTGTSTAKESVGYDLSVGGLIGYSYSDGASTLNISNCIIKSDLKSAYMQTVEEEKDGKVETVTKEVKGYMHMSGLIGYSEGSFPATLFEEDGTTFKGFEGGGRTLNINGVVINCEFSSNARHRSLVTNFKAVGYFNYENVYTTKNSAMWQMVNINYWVILNGKQTNGELGNSEQTIRDDIITILPYLANRMKNLDENGFLTGLDAVVEPLGVQTSEVKDGKYSLRFYGTANLIDEQNVIMKVKATTESGVVRTFDVTSPLLERITPFEEHQIIEKDLVAKDLEAEKMLCVTVYDIPVGEAITFEVSIQILTEKGFVINSTQTMTFSFDANGALIA